MAGKHRYRQPIRHPFVEIAGDMFLILDWFELNANARSRDVLTLVRLTSSELRYYDRITTAIDSVGHLLPRVRKRLGYRYPQLQERHG